MKTTIKLIGISMVMSLVFSSCARKYTYLHGENKNQQTQKRDLDIEVRYAGMASDHSVFEVSIRNMSPSNVTFVTRDILLRLDDMTTENVIKLYPKNKYEIRDWLYLNGRDLQRGNYRSNRPRGPYTQGKANFDEHEKIDYIRNTKPRFLGLMEGFDNQNKKYIDDWVFEREVIAPGEKVSFDLFFKRRMRSGPVQVEFFTEDDTYIIPFEFTYIVVQQNR